MIGHIDPEYYLVPACFVLAFIVLVVVLIVCAPKGDSSPCNDCGAPIPKGDLLCNSCYQLILDEEEWEARHPELWCPPRD